MRWPFTRGGASAGLAAQQFVHTRIKHRPSIEMLTDLALGHWESVPEAVIEKTPRHVDSQNLSSREASPDHRS